MIYVLADSDTLLNFIIRKATTNEKGPMIGVNAPREVYNERIIYYVIGIRGNFNFADEMTKAAILCEFVKTLGRNQLHYEVEQSINPTIRSPAN